MEHSVYALVLCEVVMHARQSVSQRYYMVVVTKANRDWFKPSDRNAVAPQKQSCPGETIDLHDMDTCLMMYIYTYACTIWLSLLCFVVLLP